MQFTGNKGRAYNNFPFYCDNAAAAAGVVAAVGPSEQWDTRILLVSKHTHTHTHPVPPSAPLPTRIFINYVTCAKFLDLAEMNVIQ